MTLKDIALTRLQNQRISSTEFNSPKDILTWMGAMQAQDYTMAKWGIGLRLKNATEKSVEDAFNKGDILRTHVMRPTWHFVAAEDIHWMIALSAPRILPSLKHRQLSLGLTSDILSKSNKLLEKLLEGGEHMTREEMRPHFTKAKILLNNNRMSHLMFCGELNGIVCSGTVRNKKQTYTLLDNRVKKKKTLARDEAVALLAKRFFVSHGPATLKDFVWWSGLTMKDARDGVEANKKALLSDTFNSKTFWMSSATKRMQTKPSAYFLPAYDEFLISYTDRSAVLVEEHHAKIISTNGIFRPFIVVNGQVTGLWNRTIKKDDVILEVYLYRKHSKAETESLRIAAQIFGKFLGKETVVKFKL